MIYGLHNRTRIPAVPHQPAWFVAKGGFDPLHARPYDTYHGIRSYVHAHPDGTDKRDPDTNEKVRTEFDEVKDTHLPVLDFEPVPMARWNTDEQLGDYIAWHLGLIGYLRGRGAKQIGAYWPVFDETYAVERTRGTIDPQQDARDLEWRKAVKNSWLTKELDYIMPPTYAYAELDPREWVPEFCEYVTSFNVPAIPFIWGKHKDRTHPDRPYVREEIADFVWKLNYMSDHGIEDVCIWFTGDETTDPGGADEMHVYHEIAQGIFS